jgi:hypothetical protein
MKEINFSFFFHCLMKNRLAFCQRNFQFNKMKLNTATTTFSASNAVAFLHHHHIHWLPLLFSSFADTGRVTSTTTSRQPLHVLLFSPPPLRFCISRNFNFTSRRNQLRANASVTFSTNSVLFHKERENTFISPPDLPRLMPVLLLDIT